MSEKYKISRYKTGIAANDYRISIENISDQTLYVLAIAMGGSGLKADELQPGHKWLEGADEFKGVYETIEEAEKAGDGI